MSNPPCDEKLAALNVKEGVPALAVWLRWAGRMGLSCFLQLLGWGPREEAAGSGPLLGADWPLGCQSAHCPLSTPPSSRSLRGSGAWPCLLPASPQCREQRMPSVGAPRMLLATWALALASMSPAPSSLSVHWPAAAPGRSHPGSLQAGGEGPKLPLGSLLPARPGLKAVHEDRQACLRRTSHVPAPPAGPPSARAEIKCQLLELNRFILN